MIVAIVLTVLAFLVIVFLTARSQGWLCWMGIHYYVKRTVIGPSGRPITVMKCLHCGKEKQFEN